MNRLEFFKYAKDKYNSEPEYLWAKSPTDAILRHKHNRKWYAAVMSVSKSKLGLPDNDIVDILDVKCDSIMIGSLLQENGFFKAYHMNKEKWITILLDGSVSEKKVRFLIDLSYQLTIK